MARQSLSLARAKKLAEEVVRDNDTHVEQLIELFVKTTAKGDSKQKAIRTAVLKAWYNETEHYRSGFREFIEQFEESEEPEGDQEPGTIESNAPAS